MSSSNAAAARWLVSDAEWAALKADYAVVYESAINIRSAQLRHDEAHPSRHYGSYRAFLDEIKYRPSPYAYINEGTLIYADVDQHDGNHKKQVLAWANEPLLESKGEATIEAENELVAAQMGSRKHEVEGLVKIVKVESMDGLREELVFHIIGAADKLHRQECLRVLSGQATTPSPRKILLLVTVVDSTLATTPNSTTGWASAYDPVDHTLIIKPFVSSPTQHPLGDSWTAPVPDDGVSFRGPPAAFVSAFLAAPAPTDKAHNAGFRSVVHIRVANWMLQYWDAFQKADPKGMSDAQKYALIEAVKDAKKALAALEFPNREGEPEPRKRRPVDGFEYLKEYLEGEEDEFREEAVRGRKEGEEGVGERIAEFWDELVGLLTRFVDDKKNWLPVVEVEDDGEGGRSPSPCFGR